MTSAASTPIESSPASPGSPVPPSVDAAQLERALFEIKRVIVGQDRLVERMLVAPAGRGHCLLEGVPGVAKTLAVETLATRGRRHVRPPAVHPRPGARRHRRHPHLPGRPGRASTSSSARCSPTSCSPTRSTARRPRCSRRCSRSWPSGRSRSAATTLPAARPVPRARHPEPDRVRGRLPAARGAARPLPDEGRSSTTRPPRRSARSSTGWASSRRSPSTVLGPDDLRRLQQHGRRRSSCTTRSSTTSSGSCSPPATPARARHGRTSPRWVSYGASPRASLGLIAAARALALLRGRDYVLPQDVLDVAADVLRHRLVLSYDALADGVPGRPHRASGSCRPCRCRRSRRGRTPAASARHAGRPARAAVRSAQPAPQPGQFGRRRPTATRRPHPA